MSCLRTWWLIALAFAASVGVEASQASEANKAPPASCAQRLQADLEKLVDLPASVWRFVVLEDPRTGHFIQYAWWGGIVVDLPLAALDQAQQARAASEFASLGAGTPEREHGSDGSRGETLTFQFDFGRDAAAAARFGCQALPRVYALAQGTHLDVTLGGD